MKKSNIPAKVVDTMMNNDWFSQWLGIGIDEITEGFCRLSMKVRKEMLNGFGIAHGGIAFSLADSALAFASNSRNRKSLVIETSASFTHAVKEGDKLVATAEEISLSPKLGVYHITVSKSDDTMVMILKGTVYRKADLWFPDEE